MENKKTVLPEPKKLETLLKGNALAQFRKKYGNDKQYIPERIDNLWYCGCGALNHKDEEKCHQCGRVLTEMEAGMDVDTLDKDFRYEAACEKMKANESKTVEAAGQELEQLGVWKDAVEKAKECKELTQKLQQQEKKKAEERKAKAKKFKKYGIIAALVAVVCVAAFMVYSNVIVPSQKYNQALQLIEEEQYYEGIAVLEELGDYKDAKDQILIAKTKHAFHCIETVSSDEGLYLIDLQEIEKTDAVKAYILEHADELIATKKYTAVIKVLNSVADDETLAELIKKCQSVQFDGLAVGDEVLFGNYEQDRNISGKELISWRVIKCENDRVLLISNFVLDVMQFDSGYTNCWENSEIRTWLNTTFVDTAFDSKEKAAVQITDVITKNSYKQEETGMHTQDRVFLLSCEEASKYVTYNDRCGIPTEFTEKRLDAGCSWWLREGTSYRKARVVTYGKTSYEGNVFDEWGVRPAIWLDLTQV